jgi:hypothetical protein
LKGFVKIMVEKGVPQEKADEYLSRYIKTAENDMQLLLLGYGQIVAKKV